MAVRLSRRLATATNAAMVTVLVTVILGLLIGLASRRAVRWELSADGVDGLTADTLAVLDRLQQQDVEVRITAFSAQLRDDEAWLRNRTMRDFLDVLERRGRTVSTRFVDFDRERLVAESFGVERYGTMVVEARGDRVDLIDRDLFRARGPRGERRVDFIGEASVAAALRRVLSERATTLVFLTGHGERPLFDRGLGELRELAQLVDDQGWQVRTVDLLRDAPDGSVPAVPDEASAVVLVGPRAPLAPAEEQALRAFLGAGGAVVLFTEAVGPLEEPLLELGVRVREGTAMDQLKYAPHVDRPYLRFGVHPITEALQADNLATVVAGARALASSEVEGVRRAPLLQTSPSGWVERGEDETYTAGEDGEGPAVVAQALELAGSHPWSRAAGPGRVVVVGDVDLVEDELLRGAPGNATFVAHALRWLVRADGGFSVVGRPAMRRPLAISAGSLRSVQWLVVGVVPLLVLLAGAVVTWLRRRR